jgi:hypothetical protein
MRAQVRLALLFAAASLVGCQTPPIVQLAGTANWKPDGGHAKELTDEETNGNGIEVGAPKIYDDASLRMMLDSARATLATMSGLNQGALTSSLGSTNGATISQSQFGLQLSAGASPSTALTNTGATNSLTTNGGLPVGNTSTPATVTVATDPTQSSTVTSTPTQPAAPTVSPGIAFTPPGSVSVSSLDMLNEQMQVTSAIESYELLLDSALSDRFIMNTRIVKPRVTLGFPISLRAPAAYKDAVAVVEVEVTTSYALSPATVPEPPAITRLIPEKTTYNVAAMTDKMTSIGAGVAIGAVGVGASYTGGHKTLFLVQDQDTVAMRLPSGANPNTASFLWEFHPVLGQRYVRGGMKQTFVQLALPVLPDLDCFGSIRIHTYWRKFDQDAGTVGDVIPESVLVSSRTFPIAHYDLSPQVAAIDYQDLGDGTLAVEVKGQYLAGTYVQFGPARFDAGKNLNVEDTGLKFTVPAAAVALWRGQIVARSGASSELLNGAVQTPLKAPNPTACIGVTPAALPVAAAPKQGSALSLGPIDIKQLNDTDSLLQIPLIMDPKFSDESRKLLLNVGGKVFGLRDAPVVRGTGKYGPYMLATVPTSLLVANPKIRVFAPFFNATCYEASADLNQLFVPGSATERLVLVFVAKSGDASYVLYGNRLQNAKVLIPTAPDATLSSLDGVSPDRVRLLTVRKAALQTTKKFVLQKEDQQTPLLLDLPPIKAPAAKAADAITVIQGTPELEVPVDRAADVTSIKLKDKALQWKATDKSTIRLSNLKADGVTTEQKSVELGVVYKNGDKATIKLDIVAARVSVQMPVKPAAATASSSTE